MSLLEIILIAIGLAMDCLAVSIASGISLKKPHWNTIFYTAISFGFFQGVMPLLGWLGASRFSLLIQNIDHWIAFAILLFLGSKMVMESRKSNEDKQAYNLSKIKVVLALSIATSIDALAVGITFAFLGMNNFNQILTPIGIIGFTSFFLSVGGFIFGIRFGQKCNLHMEFWGGLILILIGTKILIEHLFFNQ